MSKEEKRLKWRDLRLLRQSKGYSQTEFGALLGGLTQSALSILETEQPDSYVEPEYARRALEAPIKSPEARNRKGHSGPAIPLAVLGEAGPSAPGPTCPITLALGPLPPGTMFLELVPKEESTLATRIFAAVSEEESGGALAAHGAEQALAARPATRARVGFVGRSWLTRATALVALLLPIVGCLQVYRAATRGELQGSAAEPEREPLRVPGPTETDGTRAESEDPAPAPRRSIPMPKKPYSWQKLAPCVGGESERIGGCWQILDREHPPCPDYAVESEGKCLLPIPAPPRRPDAVIPKQK